MGQRRIRARLIASILIVIVLAASLAIVAHLAQPRLVFRNRDVFWYVTEYYKPVEFYGHREVEGVFDYHGPAVTGPSRGAIRDWLMQMRLWPRWRPPPMEFGVIVLSDESGQELARLPGNGGIVGGNGARANIRLQETDTQLYVSWFFTLPPNVDRSRPIRFSTTFSINDLPPLPVQVTIPPVPPPASVLSR